MQALPPKHLARRGRWLNSAKSPEYLFETLTAVAVILILVMVLANLTDRGARTGSTGQASARAAVPTVPPAAQAGTTSRPPGVATSGNLVVNWSFEQDLSGWEVLGEATPAPSL